MLPVTQKPTLIEVSSFLFGALTGSPSLDAVDPQNRIRTALSEPLTLADAGIARGLTHRHLPDIVSVFELIDSLQEPSGVTRGYLSQFLTPDPFLFSQKSLDQARRLVLERRGDSLGCVFIPLATLGLSAGAEVMQADTALPSIERILNLIDALHETRLATALAVHLETQGQPAQAACLYQWSLLASEFSDPDRARESDRYTHEVSPLQRLYVHLGFGHAANILAVKQKLFGSDDVDRPVVKGLYTLASHGHSLTEELFEGVKDSEEFFGEICRFVDDVRKKKRELAEHPRYSVFFTPLPPVSLGVPPSFSYLHHLEKGWHEERRAKDIMTRQKIIDSLSVSDPVREISEYLRVIEGFYDSLLKYRDHLQSAKMLLKEFSFTEELLPTLEFSLGLDTTDVRARSIENLALLDTFISSDPTTLSDRIAAVRKQIATRIAEEMEPAEDTSESTPLLFEMAADQATAQAALRELEAQTVSALKKGWKYLTARFHRLVALGRYEEAMTALDMALKDPTMDIEFKDIVAHKRFLLSLQIRDIPEALAFGERTLGETSRLAILRCDVAIYLAGEGKLREALVHLDAFLRNIGNHPYRAIALFTQARIYNQHGQPEKAEVILREMIKNGSNIPRIYLMLALSLLLQDDPNQEEIRELLRVAAETLEALKITSLNADSKETPPLMRSELNALEEAESLWRMLSQQLAPTPHEIDRPQALQDVLTLYPFFKYGVTHPANEDLVRRRQALALAQRMLRQDPDNVDYLTLIGDLYREQDRLEEAHAYYRQALAHIPDSQYLKHQLRA